MAEQFQPIAVAPPAERPLLFWLRCLVDLQLATIVRPLKPALSKLQGRVLDVGAGMSPWRSWLPTGAAYQGIDIGNATEFGMAAERSDVVYYGGKVMPLEASSFDAAICIEVLEHAEDPGLLLSEIARVLRPGGVLVLTVPWSARRHHIPHDYHRFTQERLQSLLAASGFASTAIAPRGNDIGAIANKLVVLSIRLARPRPLTRLLWTWPLFLLTAPIAAAFLAAAHLSFRLRLGSEEDPLGYFVTATRAEAPVQPSHSHE